MTRDVYWIDGAETGSMAIALDEGTGWSVQSSVLPDSYSAYSYVSTTGGSTFAIGSTASGSTAHIHCLVLRFSDATPTSRTLLFEQYVPSQPGNFGWRIYLNTDGTIDAEDESSTVRASSSAAAFSDNTWHRFSVFADRVSGSVIDEFVVEIDGDPVINYSGTWQATYVMGAALYVTNPGGTMYVDNFVYFSQSFETYEENRSPYDWTTDRYTHDQTTATADQPCEVNSLSTRVLDSGTWDNINDVPWQTTNEAIFSGTSDPDGHGGVNEYNGPGAQTYPAGSTWWGIALHAELARDGGGGTSHKLVFTTRDVGVPAGNYPNPTIANEGVTTTLTTAYTRYTRIIHTPDIYDGNGDIDSTLWVGLWKDDGGQNLECRNLTVEAAIVFARPAGIDDLSASPGSFALTGSAAEFTRSLQHEASAGSFALTGSDANIALSYQAAIDAQSFALSGQDVAFLNDVALAAEAGSFALTGDDAAFLNALVEPIDAQSYSLTGQDIDFLLATTFSAEAGTFDLTGQDVAYQNQLVTQIDPQSFTLTGGDTALLNQLVVQIDPQSFALTGSDANLDFDEGSFAAESGSFALTGVAADLDRTYVTQIDAQTFTLTGAAADLDVTLRFQAETGSFTYTGTDANLLRALAVDASAGGFTYTGEDANFARGLVAGIDAQTFTLTSANTDLIRSVAYDLEGFRFRNDDANEANATWKAAQDANLTETKGVNVRLRTLIDAAGNPDPAQVTLQYRKVGDPDWKTVQ